MSKENQMSKLSIRIDKKFASSSHTVSNKPYIFRVDELLRKDNERAYEPEILAIGPYHRNKDHLKMMEGHKRRYIQEFLERRNELSLGRYVKAMEELEEKARNCYADPFELDWDQFVDMMLVDGIFIMELLRNFRSSESRKTDILQLNRFQNILVRDILLFENQLPLFVLIRLSDLAYRPHFSVEDAFWIYIREQTRFIRSNQFIGPPREVELHHLLSVMRYAIRPSFLDHLGDDFPFGSELTRCATELQDVRIKFKVGWSDSWMGIEFTNGIMEIPVFNIDDDTELLLRNLIAFEQNNLENEWAYVSSYVKFMNCLIKSPNDVKILRQRKIFSIAEGMDDKSAFSMFKKLNSVVIVPSQSFCYSKICYQIEEHCKGCWARWRPRFAIWMTELKQDYFKSPWSILSLIAAFLLLVLTAIQTVCSILQV